MNEHLYYENLEDGTIGRSTNDAAAAAELGLELETDREIVYGYDGKRYFRGEEPTPPPMPKKYSIPDLFFWLRGYDERHPDVRKGQSVVDFLNGQNLYTIAVTTRVVSEENELFAPTLAAIKEAVGFTDEEVAEALAYADTSAAPDAEAWGSRG